MKKIISLFIALVMLAAALSLPSLAADFSDVEADRWSSASVKYAVDNGYMKGVGGGLFDPEGSLTRAMVATVLWRREGEPAPTAPSGFSDVPAGEWYTDAVAWAKETGVVKGLTETTFGPDENITREQLATMLFRFSSSAPVSVPERADLTPFADDEKVSDWADEPLEWAVEAGLLKGTDGNRLDPEGYATREQFAAVIERYDGSFKLAYNVPVIRSHYTEPEYPLVKDADFYVSTNGSDENEGSFEKPFATFEKAVEAVRALDKTGRDGITVAFMAGEYGPLEINLGAEDSGTPECPITYCKYGDGDVVFNNGFDIDASEFEPLREEEKVNFPAKAVDKIMRADVSDRIAPGKYDLSYCVFSDDALCTVARYPNKYDDGSDQLMLGAAYVSDENHYTIVSSYLKKRIDNYHSIDSLKLYGYLTVAWAQETLNVGGYDSVTGELLIMNPENSRSGRLRLIDDNGTPSIEWVQVAFLNVSEELDDAGEYFVDPETSVLYVYDPRGNYHVTVKDRMITAEGANDITFRGLSFVNVKDSVMNCTVCHDITIDLCRFERIGGTYGLYFYTHDPGRDFNFTLTRSEFDLAMDCFLGIYGKMTSENVGYATHMNVLIDNNSFTNYNLFRNEECALYVSHCDEVRISHNEFLHGGRGAVFYGMSQNVVIEYNVAADQMRNAVDGGVFSTWNDLYHRGNVVRYNIIGPVTSQGLGGFGLYLDDWDTGTEVYSNLFYDCGGEAVVVHNGRDNVMHDNAVVNTSGNAAVFHATLSGMYADGAEPGVPTDGDLVVIEAWNKVFERYENNPALKANAMAQWPEIFDLTTDPERWDDPMFVLARNNTVTDNCFFNQKGDVGTDSAEYVVKYSTISGNVGYTLNENPVFVNPTRGDYRIKDGAGFPDIRFELIGRY